MKKYIHEVKLENGTKKLFIVNTTKSAETMKKQFNNACLNYASIVNQNWIKQAINILAENAFKNFDYVQKRIPDLASLGMNWNSAPDKQAKRRITMQINSCAREFDKQLWYLNIIPNVLSAKTLIKYLAMDIYQRASQEIQNEIFNDSQFFKFNMSMENYLKRGHASQAHINKFKQYLILLRGAIEDLVNNTNNVLTQQQVETIKDNGCFNETTLSEEALSKLANVEIENPYWNFEHYIETYTNWTYTTNYQII